MRGVPLRNQLLLFGALVVALAAIAGGLAWHARGAPSSGPIAASAPEPAPPSPAESPPADEPAPARRADSLASASASPPAAPPRPPLAPPPGPGVSGTVRDTAGDPVAGARVLVQLEVGARTFLLATEETGADGRYAAELDLPQAVETLEVRIAEDTAVRREFLAELDEQGAREAVTRMLADLERASGGRVQPVVLAVEAGLPGRGWRRVPRELRLPVPARVRVDVRLATGSVVEGRVFHRGSPVPAALVQLFDADWNFVRSSMTDLEGRYRVGVPEPGRFQLHARAIGLGASGNEGFSLGDALPFPEIDVDVDGFVALNGRVTLPDGQPIRCLQIEALQYGLWQGEAFNGRRVDAALVAQAESAGGLCASEAATDEHGVFRMAGMQSGGFALRIPALRDETLQPRGVYSTGAESHEIVLDVHLLVVEVRAHRYRFRERRAPEIEVLCVADPPLVESGYTAGELAYSPSADLGATFVVEPGARYVVRAQTRSATAKGEIVIADAPRVQRLQLVLEDWDPKVAAELDLWSEEAPGTLELELTDPAGEPVRSFVAVLAREEDGREFRLEPYRGADASVFVLPPGVYQLDVEPTGEAALGLMPLHGIAFRVGSNETSRVERELVAGGSFVLRLPATQDPSVRSRMGRARLSEAHALALRADLVVSLRVHCRDVEPATWRALELELAGDERDAGPARVARLLPGEEGRSPALEVGRYLVELRGESIAGEWIELEIEAGARRVIVPELRPAGRT